MKIKGSYKILNEIKQFFTKDKKVTFLVTVFTAMLAHFQLYALVLTGPDTLINSMYHWAGMESTLGRFGLYFVQAIKGNVVSPFLATLISCILLGVTVVLITDILKIKNKYFQIILAILFAVAPNISVTLTFFYCSDAYLLGMFLATVAVFLIRNFEKNRYIILVSSLCIAWAMGMYQTYLSVTMVLCVATLIVDLLENKSIKEIGSTTIKYVIMGVLGVALYYIFSQLILKLRGLQMSDYSGGNEIGLSTLLMLPDLLPQAYTSFYNYFFTDAMIPNSVWNTNLVYIAIFIAMASSLVYIIVKNKIEKINIFLIIVLLLIAPICFGVIEIMVPEVNIHLLMACSMILVFPIFFKIIEMLPKNNLADILKFITVVGSMIIAWNYIWQDNASYIVMKSQGEQLENVMTRVVTRIESQEGYDVDMPVVMLGQIHNNPYFNKMNTQLEAKDAYKISYGFVSNWPLIWEDNILSWYKFFYEYMGINMNVVGTKSNQKIMHTEEYKEMEAYPSNKSIKIIDNTVVVKLQ